MAKFFKDWYDKSYDYGYTPAYSTGKKFTYAQCHPRGNNLIGKVGRGGLYAAGWLRGAHLELGWYMIDLASRYDIPATTTRAFEYSAREAARGTDPRVLSLPIRDMDVPTYSHKFWEYLTNEVRRILESGKCILVACDGGHGRTGMVIAILGYKLGIIPQGQCPIEWVRANYCKGAIETTPQEQYVYTMLGLDWTKMPVLLDVACIICGTTPLDVKFGDDTDLGICSDCIDIYHITEATGGKVKYIVDDKQMEMDLDLGTIDEDEADCPVKAPKYVFDDDEVDFLTKNTQEKLDRLTRPYRPTTFLGDGTDITPVTHGPKLHWG